MKKYGSAAILILGIKSGVLGSSAAIDLYKPLSGAEIERAEMLGSVETFFTENSGATADGGKRRRLWNKNMHDGYVGMPHEGHTERFLGETVFKCLWRLKMKRIFGFFCFWVIVCSMTINISSCATPPEVVTQSLYRTLGQDTFSQFRFYISQDVVLTEIVPPDIQTDRSKTRVQVTAYNNVVNIKSSTSGRVQGNATADRLEIAFEQLKDGTKPTIGFVQKNSDGRYYFDYEVSDWIVADSKGRLTNRHGPGIQYNGKTYLLEFKGMDEPYLLYDQDVTVKDSKKTMGGLR